MEIVKSIKQTSKLCISHYMSIDKRTYEETIATVNIVRQELASYRNALLHVECFIILSYVHIAIKYCKYYFKREFRSRFTNACHKQTHKKLSMLKWQFNNVLTAKIRNRYIYYEKGYVWNARHGKTDEPVKSDYLL